MIRIYVWTELMKAKLSEEQGAGLAEYALLLFVVAAAAASIVGIFGDNIIQTFTDANTELPTGATP